MNSDFIMQRLLRDYYDAHRIAKQTATKAAELRREILERAAAGEEVEPGPLDCRIDVRQVRRLTRDSIAKLLGDEEAEALVTRIEPTEQTFLRVYERSAAPVGRGWRQPARRATRDGWDDDYGY